jgi:hypothetical protein
MARATDWRPHDTLKAQGLADREIARQWAIAWGMFHREKQKREASLPMQTPPVSQSAPGVSREVPERVSDGVSKGVSLASREKTERWNLHLPRDLITKTKAKAQGLGLHPSELVAEILRQWLVEQAQEDT